MPTLPDFIGIGATKAGTTSLHDLLFQHPEIYLPSFKEVHFFDNPDNFSKGQKWYEKLAFGDYKGQKIKGEITPSYVFFKECPIRIKETLGVDTKFILMLRNPADRAWSHYQMQYARGNERLSFMEALTQEKSRLEQGFLAKLRFGYLAQGYYAEQLDRYFAHFPRENFHIILFEQFVKDQESSIQKTLEFLNVSKSVNLNFNIRSNPATKQRNQFVAKTIFQPSRFKDYFKPLFPEKIRRKTRKALKRLNEGEVVSEKIDADIREQLINQFFKDDIKHLSNLINIDLKDWYKK